MLHLCYRSPRTSAYIHKIDSIVPEVMSNVALSMENEDKLYFLIRVEPRSSENLVFLFWSDG